MNTGREFTHSKATFDLSDLKLVLNLITIQRSHGHMDDGLEVSFYARELKIVQSAQTYKVFHKNNLLTY